MRHFLTPTGEAGSAYRIDYEALFDRGIRGILFDIDNTLVPHGAPATKEALALFERLRRIGLKACLISNNGEARVAPFAKAVGAEYVYKAGKPKTKGYRHGMSEMGTTPADTLFVGDQLFTDVCGANLAGIETCLVKPIHPKEEIQIAAKRLLERPILFFYRLRGKGRRYE